MIRRASQPIETRLLLGAIAGVVATAAMTIGMEAMFRRLPKQEQYPLPPRELTEAAAAAVRLRRSMDEPTLQAATVASHFGFGALAGTLYGALFRARSSTPVLNATGFGVLVWAFSYLGWIPGVGLLRPATAHPAPRNGLMVAAHVVWGATLGFVAHRLSQALTPFRGGPLRDR